MEKKFQQSIDKLKAQLENIDQNNTEVRNEMRQLIDDLEHHAAHPDDQEHLEKLNGKVPQLIAKFELEHPKLAETLNEIMVILSNMGI